MLLSIGAWAELNDVEIATDTLEEDVFNDPQCLDTFYGGGVYQYSKPRCANAIVNLDNKRRIKYISELLQANGVWQPSYVLLDTGERLGTVATTNTATNMEGLPFGFTATGTYTATVTGAYLNYSNSNCTGIAYATNVENALYIDGLNDLIEEYQANSFSTTNTRSSSYGRYSDGICTPKTTNPQFPAYVGFEINGLVYIRDFPEAVTLEYTTE